MIDFIFGDAGSGKSEYVYNWITDEAAKHADRNYFLFVPEQNTLKAQREIIAHSACRGMLNLDVLSFQLLAYRVMHELGIEKPVVIDDVSKSILIRRAAIEAADELKVYKRRIASDGFIRQIKDIIGEFCLYDVSIDRLRKASEEARLPLLKGKLSDISLIYERFRKMLSDRAAIPEDLAYMLLSCIAESKLLKDAVIVFDGYTGFTPIQARLLEHIIPTAARCRFAVSIPMSAAPYRASAEHGVRDLSDMFMLSRDTVARVCRIAEQNNIQRGGEIEIRRDRVMPPVHIMRAEDPVDEVRLAARSIRTAALRDGVRYNRMAVAVSDMSVYAELIKSEFEHESIPYFMDDRSNAGGSPAIEYIRSVLRLICRGYRAEDITAFIRNPLISGDAETRDTADLADNYLRKTGLRGRKTYADIAAALDITGVSELEQSLKECSDIGTMADAVRAFAESSELAARSDKYAAELESRGFARQGGECRRFSGFIGELLDRISAILGAESCSMDEFRKLLDAGFADMKGGSVPETMDTVLIGDLKRSRLDDIDYLFVIGANDGLIPSTVTGGGIFTDYERNELMRSDIELAPDDKTDSCIQHFYMRLILNKPDKELFISYAARGRDDKARRPSSVIAELERGSYGDFDNIENRLADTGDMISSRRDALKYIASRIASVSEEDERFFDTYKVLKELGESDMLMKMAAAAYTGHKTDRLTNEAAAALYNEMLKGYITRIEDYESCPFYHFIQHGLRLRDRETAKIANPDAGKLFHSALDSVFKTLQAERRDIRDIGEKELDKLSSDAIENAVNAYKDNILGQTARNRYIADKLRRIMRRSVRTLKTQLEDGDFKAFDTEHKFRFPEDDVMLTGCIDRVDCCESDGRTYVKVIDYKSGNKTFSVSRLANGLELQLITYMNAAVRLLAERSGSYDNIVPAGMFYYHIDDPTVKYSAGISADDAENEKLNALRMNGAVNKNAETAVHIDRQLESDIGEAEIDKKQLKHSGVIKDNSELMSEDEFRGFMKYAHERIRHDTERIMSGDINVRPYRDGQETKCDYCGFRGICGFDPQIEGYDYRNIRKFDKNAVKELLSRQFT